MSSQALIKVEQFRARSVVPRIEDVYSKLLAVQGETCMTGVPTRGSQSPTHWADLGRSPGNAGRANPHSDVPQH